MEEERAYQTKKFNFQSIHLRSRDATQFRIISILIIFIVEHFCGEEDAVEEEKREVKEKEEVEVRHGPCDENAMDIQGSQDDVLHLNQAIDIN